jgi:phage shock protein A
MAATLGRTTRTGLQILGFVGLLVCALLAGGILVGRAWASDTVGQVFVSADTAIADGLSTIDDARARLAERVAPLDEAISELSAAPAASAVPAAVAARLSSVTDGYAAARDRAVAARAQAESALRIARVASGVVPGFSVPPGVETAVIAVDDRLNQLDAAVQRLRNAALTTASEAVAAAQTLRDAVSSVTDAAGNVRTQVEGLRVTIADAHATVDRGLWVGAGGLLILIAYVALLNALIIWLVRRAPRPEPRAVESEAPEGVTAA